MRGLTDKRVLITGAAQGIGSATAMRFAEEGSIVILNDLQDFRRSSSDRRFDS